MEIEGFTDATALIRCGVYILLYRGEVVFIGKATGAMLGRISAHRSLAKKPASPWVPVKGVTFDQVLIRTVHPDRLDSTHAALVMEYSPRLNLPSPCYIPTSQPILRRI